jgi:hypothetical protein
MKIHLTRLLSCMIIISGTISKLTSISQLSRNGRIQLPLSYMLIGLICSKSMIQCSTKSLPRPILFMRDSLGIFYILVMYQDWNTRLVAQFRSTAWRSGNGYESTINFSIEGHQFSVCVMEFPTIFASLMMTL